MTDSRFCTTSRESVNDLEIVQLFDIQWATASLQQDIIDAQIELLLTYPFFTPITWSCADFSYTTNTDGMLGKHHISLCFRKPTTIKASVDPQIQCSDSDVSSALTPGMLSVSNSLVQSMYASTLSASTDRFDLKIDIAGLLLEPIYITFICSGKNLTAIAPSPALARLSVIRNPGGEPLLTSSYKSIVLNPNTRFVDCSAYMADMLRPQRVVSLGTKSRIGKTFGLSMMQAFLSPYSSVKALNSFSNLAISEWSQYDRHLGNYPVLSLDFSVFSVSSTDTFYASMAEYIKEVYGLWYGTCAPILNEEKNGRIFTEIMGSTSAGKCRDFKTGLFGSFAELCKFIFKATHKHPVVLVDGYDALTRKLWYAPHDTLPNILPMISLILTATVTENMCKYCAVVAGGLDPPAYSGFGYINTNMGMRSLKCSPEMLLDSTLRSQSLKGEDSQKNTQREDAQAHLQLVADVQEEIGVA